MRTVRFQVQRTKMGESMRGLGEEVQVLQCQSNKARNPVITP